MTKARESKPVLFIVANFCHFAKNKMAQQHQQWIFLEICDQNSPDFKEIKLKRTRFLP
jgi:protein-tyrosine phosphatase